MAEELKTTKTTKTATKTTTVKKATPKKAVAEETVAAPKATVAKKVETKKETKSVKQIKVTLVRSPIGYNKKQTKVLVSLGLNKLQSSNILPDNAAVRGMAFKVRHLVTVEEI